jgi:hypothetical protein
MAPDRTILHLVENKFRRGADPDPFPFKIMACTLLSLSYAPTFIVYHFSYIMTVSFIGTFIVYQYARLPKIQNNVFNVLAGEQRTKIKLSEQYKTS